jgi:hypothetical protein
MVARSQLNSIPRIQISAFNGMIDIMSANTVFRDQVRTIILQTTYEERFDLRTVQQFLRETMAAQERAEFRSIPPSLVLELCRNDIVEFLLNRAVGADA